MHLGKVIKNMISTVIFLLLMSYSRALPSGAPTTVCQTMAPYHGGGSIPPQTGIPPYTVSARRQGGVVEVTIESPLGVNFEGFMLQGRTPTGELIGRFEVEPTSGAHTVSCAQPGDAVTHNKPEQKEYLTATWIPPVNYEGPVVFNSTIAENYSTFWVGVPSPTIQISRRSVVDDPIRSRPARPGSTTPPYYSPERERQNSAEFDPFYAGCGNTKLCFGAPAGCVESKNCKAAVAVSVIANRYEFEMKADANAQWIGVGLSDDDKMGEDSVIECVKGPNGVTPYMSWTKARPYSAQRLSNPQLGIQLLNASIVNDMLYCKVQRNVVTMINEKLFDLVNDKFNLLIAAGSSVTANSVGFHDIVFLPSGEQRVLSDVSSLAAASKLLIRLHGSFMLAAWIGTASIGILLARYYRHTCVGTTMMGKDLWFAWHRIFMVLTWLLTMAAFILIFVELKAWSGENNPHAILGTIVSVLCFFQPIGAYFRPHPGTTKRPIFNWIHWLVGNTAHIVGIVTIFFAVKLTKAELPDFMDYILAAYVVVQFITHLVLSVMNCISEKRSDSRVSSFPMKDLGGHGRSSAYDHNMDSPFSPVRKFLLGIYILIVLLLVIALIVITSLAPIPDTWNKLTT